MARYPISKEGVTAFEQLKKDLQDITRQISDESNKLRSVAKANEEECGYLQEDIEEMLRMIEKFEDENEDKIRRVNGLIDVQIQKIEEFLNSRL